MDVLILSDGNSTHTRKWASELSRKSGLKFGLFSINQIEDPDFYAKLGIKTWSLAQSPANSRGAGFRGLLRKFSYLFSLGLLRRILKEEKPGILHAHFASSYGLLAALVRGGRKLMVSYWGSDIFVFPNKSVFARGIIHFINFRAHALLSTSHVMAKEIAKFTAKKIQVTPFGVDMDIFHPNESRRLFSSSPIRIICTKSLVNIYGQGNIIKALALMDLVERKIELVLVGDGPSKKDLEKLVSELNLSPFVKFVGRVDNSKIPDLLRSADIALFPTLCDPKLVIESFGVAAVEAQACRLPVIVSKSGGLTEIVDDKKTGYVLPENTPQEIAKMILFILDHKEKAEAVARSSQISARNRYEINRCTKIMLETYAGLMAFE